MIDNENKEIEIMNKENPIVCFAIMPFSKEFTNVWSAINACVKKLSTEMDREIVLRRADEHTIDSRLSENVTNNIKDCDIAIVDLTGENPNVVFEFGHVIACEKNFIPMTQLKNVSELASDYNSYIYLQYDRENMDHFISRLSLKLINEIKRIGEKEESNKLKVKLIADKDVFQVDCIKNREKANLQEIFEAAETEINIIQTNMSTVLKEYAPSIKVALEKNKELVVRFLALNPESYFTEIRATQLGFDVSEFRNELHDSLFKLHKYFEKYDNVFFKIYDDFPTQISFIIDGEIYNCVVSKYQQSRSNCLFRLDSSYPVLHTSFNLHFISVWRDKATTKRYNPIYRRKISGMDD